MSTTEPPPQDPAEPDGPEDLTTARRLALALGIAGVAGVLAGVWVAGGVAVGVGGLLVVLAVLLAPLLR